MPRIILFLSLFLFGYAILNHDILAEVPVGSPHSNPIATPHSPAIPREPIELYADKNSGHDWSWSKRHYYGLSTWGIRGSRIQEAGEIWFDSFPGETGVYEISIRAIFEQDGRPKYALNLGARTVSEGSFPYLRGEKNCDGRGAESVLNLGKHRVVKGERVAVWGQSVYECPWRQGAYTLWEKLIFKPVLSDGTIAVESVTSGVSEIENRKEKK